MTQRYTGTGIILCPDKLAVFYRKQSGTAGLSSLYDGRLFLYNFIQMGGLPKKTMKRKEIHYEKDQDF